MRAAPAWHSVFAGNGVEVFCTHPPGETDEIRVLPRQGGVIFGTVFARALSDDPMPQIKAVIGANESDRIVQSAGRELIERFDFQGVAILRADDDTVYALRDPTSRMPCFTTVHQDVRLYCSDIRDCLKLGLRFSVNRRYLIASLVLPTLYVEETGLNEVRELLGGQRDALRAGKIASDFLWHPFRFIKEPIEDPAEAVRRLRNTVLSCVRTRAAQHEHIGHLLSGGVDSSIVLACMKEMPNRPRITCFTLYSNYLAGDERHFAQAALKTVPGCDWITQPADTAVSLKIMLSADLGPRPRSYHACLNERPIVRALRSTGVKVVFNGSGGDAYFFKRREGAMDHFLRRGLRPTLWHAIKNEARLRRVSVPRVIRDGLREHRNRSHWNPFADLLQHRKLLGPAAIELATHDYKRYRHPWVEPVEDLSPGQRYQVQMLCQPFFITRYLPEPGDPVDDSPLANLRLMEDGLRIPPDLHTRNCRTRSIACEAFASELPSLVYSRENKGDTREHTATVWRLNRPLAREYLPDCRLVRDQVVDRDKMNIALSETPGNVSPDQMLQLLNYTIWESRWEELCR